MICKNCNGPLSDQDERHGYSTCHNCAPGHTPEGSHYASSEDCDPTWQWWGEVEFFVSVGSVQWDFNNEFLSPSERFNQASAFALSCSLRRGGAPVTLDVCIYSERAALEWGGDSALESWADDPEASVSERYVIRAEPLGRVA